MNRTDTYKESGSRPRRRRARTFTGVVQSVFRRTWVMAASALALLALTVWMDTHLGYLTGVRVLYVLPIWLGICVGGVRVGILSALVVTGIIGWVDLAQLRMEADVAWPNGIARFVSLGLVALVIAHLEFRLSTARNTAIHDPLTGALNRTELKTRADQAIAYSRTGGPSVALALIDCDNFKLVNDTHGHASGDRALRSLARILETIDGKAVTVGRMGGDEFAVLFEGVDEAKVRKWMETAAHEYTVEMKKYGCNTTISVGLAFHCEEPVTFQKLLELADRLMYAQKRQKSLSRTNAGGPSPATDPLLRSAYRETPSSLDAPIKGQ